MVVWLGASEKTVPDDNLAWVYIVDMSSVLVVLALVWHYNRHKESAAPVSCIPHMGLEGWEMVEEVPRMMLGELVRVDMVTRPR